MSRPAWGIAPIKCAKSRCKWRGYETGLQQVASRDIEGMTEYVCPDCKGDSYMFMTPNEIAAWNRIKATKEGE